MCTPVVCSSSPATTTTSAFIFVFMHAPCVTATVVISGARTSAAIIEAMRQAACAARSHRWSRNVCCQTGFEVFGLDGWPHRDLNGWRHRRVRDRNCIGLFLSLLGLLLGLAGEDGSQLLQCQYSAEIIVLAIEGPSW